MTEKQFDVFLAHSSKDKPLVRQLYGQLRSRGIRPWLDEVEVLPGVSFQDELSRVINEVGAVAILIGTDELSRWQALELRSLIEQCIEQTIPIIPVLLPGTTEIPRSLLFLKEFQWVSFQNGINDKRALYQLEWGVTLRKPDETVCNTPLRSSPDNDSEKCRRIYVLSR